MKFLGLLFAALAMFLFVFWCCSCAQMSPNDGLVPRMSAQANLPYTVDVTPSGNLMASPSRSVLVSPLNDARKAYWSTP